MGELEARPVLLQTAGERFLFCVRWREFGQTAGPTAPITVYPASHKLTCQHVVERRMALTEREAHRWLPE